MYIFNRRKAKKEIPANNFFISLGNHLPRKTIDAVCSDGLLEEGVIHLLLAWLSCVLLRILSEPLVMPTYRLPLSLCVAT